MSTYTHAIATLRDGLAIRGAWQGKCVECGMMTGAAARDETGKHVPLCRKCQQRLGIWPEKTKRGQA